MFYNAHTIPVKIGCPFMSIFIFKEGVSFRGHFTPKYVDPNPFERSY
jgi:hypothetical protein